MLNAENQEKFIDVLINSPGGEINSGLAMYDVIQSSKARLICYRVKNHILMRIDIYWNSVLRHHPDNACMPVLPILEIKDDAEEVYLRQHKELMKRATTFHDLIQDEATKKEVA